MGDVTAGAVIAAEPVRSILRVEVFPEASTSSSVGVVARDKTSLMLKFLVALSLSTSVPIRRSDNDGVTTSVYVLIFPIVKLF